MCTVIPYSIRLVFNLAEYIVRISVLGWYCNRHRYMVRPMRHTIVRKHATDGW